MIGRQRLPSLSLRAPFFVWRFLWWRAQSEQDWFAMKGIPIIQLMDFFLMCKWLKTCSSGSTTPDHRSYCYRPAIAIMPLPPPPLYCSIGSPTTNISHENLRETIEQFLESLGQRDDVLLLPPDFTRYHSQAGTITRFISEYYNFLT